MIDTKCPFCQIESEADDNQLGKAVRCPGCRKVFILHAHSTEIPLDPIIPGVPMQKPDGSAPASGSKPDTVKVDPAFRHTLKFKHVQKPAAPPSRPVSPLLDPPEPPPVPAQPVSGKVELVGVRVPFLDILRTTFFVMLSILLVGTAFGLVVLAVLGFLGKLLFRA